MIELVIDGRRKDLGGFEVGRILPFAKKRMVWPEARSSGEVRSEWTMPFPAVIQLTSPGRIAWRKPRLS